MPTYIMLANWTEQGAQRVKDSPRRVEARKRRLSIWEANSRPFT